MGSGMNKEAYDLVRYDHAFRVPKRERKREGRQSHEKADSSRTMGGVEGGNRMEAEEVKVPRPTLGPHSLIPIIAGGPQPRWP